MGMDFDTQTHTRSPLRIQTLAKHQVTASWNPSFLKSLVLAYRQHELGPGSRAEPVKACPVTAASVAGGERETSRRRIRKELSTEAGHAGGLARSSCEASACRSGGGAKGRGRPG